MRVEDAFKSTKEPSKEAEGSASEDSSESSEYSYRGELRGELKSILGVDDGKADRLMRLFCEVAREEMNGGFESEDAEASSDTSAAKSVAAILGRKPKE